MIDWHGQAGRKDAMNAPRNRMPEVRDVYNDLALHNVYIPSLDDPPSMEELVEAINSSGKGVRFDGLPPEILQLLPNQLKEVILKLIVNVFFADHPTTWEKQILHDIPKDERTTKVPKMRGIAIPPI